MDDQGAGGAVGGLEGQGTGVRSDGFDENHVQVRFVLRVGVPAVIHTVIVPAVNGVVAVRVTVQRPVAAGSTKGNGGVSAVLDVVTGKSCMVVVQLHIIRKSSFAIVSETAAVAIEIFSGVITDTAGEQSQL